MDKEVFQGHRFFGSAAHQRVLRATDDPAEMELGVMVKLELRFLRCDSLGDHASRLLKLAACVDGSLTCPAPTTIARQSSRAEALAVPAAVKMNE